MAVFTFISSISAIGFQAAFTTFAATYTGQFLISLATSALLGALSPKPAAAAQRGYDTNVLGPALDHTIIYGKTKVGGVVVYNESTGTNNKFLHRIITVAGHEVESFERIYIDDAYIDFINLGTSGNVASVVDPDGTTSDRYNNKLRIQVAYGTPTQAANADLVAQSDSKWTASHKLSGIAYIYVRLAFDADVYPNGIPTFTAEIKGKKVFDPRTSTTGWSDNPALCVRDYLTSTGYGLGEIADNIDDDLTKAAADICDQTVFSATRYTTNGSFTTGATPYDLISSILPSMGGSLWYAQGKWRMKPAYWTTPVMFLDEDDLRSSISVSTRHSRRDNFNVIKGKFTGPDTNWQSVDYKEVRNESDAGTFVTGLPYSISEVGTTDFTAIGAASNTVGEVFTATGAGTGTGVADLNLGVDNGLTSVADVDLLFTDTMKEARRLGRITLERNRQQLTIGASFGLKTLGLQVGDNVYITNTRFGWTNKAFEVLSWNFGLTDGLDLQTEMTLRETAESVFDEVDDAAIYEADNTNLPSPFFVPVPSLDAAVITTTINEDGTAVPAIDFSWGVSNSQVVDYYDFQWKLIGDTNYSSTVVEEPRFRLAPALSGAAYNYRVRAVNTLGIKSIYVSGASSVSTGNDTTIPKAPTSVSVSGGYAATTVEWTSPTQNTDNSAIKDLFQYEVYRGTSTNPTTLVGRVAGTTFSDIGLNDSTTYHYRVKALDFTGNSSAYSSNGSATTNPALENGQTGASTNIIFKRSATAPSTPSPSSGIPSGWYNSPPAGTELIWASSGTKLVGATNFTWETPFQIEGATIAEVSIYRLNNSSGGTGGSYNFVTQTLTPPTSWSTNPPNLASNNDTIYRKSGVASGAATQTSASVSYGSAVVYAKRTDGTDGTDGARGAGRWNIGVSALPTTSSGANTAFVAAIGSPVDKDQAWFYTGTVANPTSQGVWLYDAGTPVWIEQDEVIDGNLLVTGTVTANSINADAITGKNVTVGTLTSTSVPTGSQKGARIQADGTMFVGDKNEFFRWDGSVLSLSGEIVNLGDFNKTPYSGGWSSFNSSINLGNKMDLLGGAGKYAIFMGGAGGSGSASGRTSDVTSYACGGSSGAGAFFLFDYDGSNNVQFVAGSGGAGVEGGGSTGSNNNGRDGNNGGNSLFQVEGSTKVTCSGGSGGVASNSTGASGPPAPSTPSDSRITEFVGYSGGAGGSAVATGASGGGGLGLFYTTNNRGGNANNNNATAGGGPFGRGGDSSSGGRATGPAYPEDSNGFTINTTPVKVVSSPAGYFSGGSGAVDVVDRVDGTDSTGFLGGRGSWNFNGTATAGNGGFLAGGGGALVTGDDVATAGSGGPAGGGGGANKSDNTAGDFPLSGDGGSGVIFIKKL